MNARTHRPDWYTGAIISTELYISLEMKRWILHNETPGKFGIFGTDEVAA